MFGRKVEIKLVKDNNHETLVDATPSITKEDVIHVTRNVVKYVAGAVLVTLATAAVLDTAKFAAMTGIENRSPKELED